MTWQEDLDAVRVSVNAALAERDAVIANRDQIIADQKARIAELEAPVVVPEPEPVPVPAPVPTPPVAAGRFGTHWPTRTPRPSATDPVVACTWAAISTAVKNAAPGTAIAVQPGTLTGQGAGSAKPGELNNIDKGLGQRVLIYPKNGYGSVRIVSPGLSFVNVKGLAFVGFQATGTAVLFRNSQNVAWGWSELDHRRVTANQGGTAGDIEWVECVSRGTLYKSDDRHRFITAGSTAATVTNVYTIGGYDSSIYRPTGSDAHCDSTQVERQTGGGVIKGIHFKDYTVFGSHSQTFMFSGGIPGVTFDNVTVVGGLANERRYPRDLSKTAAHVYVPIALHGDAQCVLTGRNTVAGKINSGWTFSGIGTLEKPATAAEIDALYVRLDRDHPEPTDAELAAAWKL